MASLRRRRSHLRVNRAMWQRQSASYDRRFRRVLSGPHAEAWGLWRVPESTLRLLPPVRGRSTLEVGCGAARWSVSLARRGARAVGVDLSSAQLAHARTEVANARVAVALVQGSAERIPFAARSFELVFCDWGALTFADPYRTIPECARVLRPGGRLVFATASPIAWLVLDVRADRLTRRLLRPYFGLHRLDFPDEVDFQLPYGEWIGLFRQCGLSVERLIETRPTPRDRSAYLNSHEERWARRWPKECLWQLRKDPEEVSPGRKRSTAGSVGSRRERTAPIGSRAARAPSRRSARRR